MKGRSLFPSCNWRLHLFDKSCHPTLPDEAAWTANRPLLVCHCQNPRSLIRSWAAVSWKLRLKYLGRYGWWHLQLVSYLIHWRVCTPKNDNASRDGLRCWIAIRFPRLDIVYSKMLQRICATFWHGCYVFCLMTMSTKYCVTPHMECMALQGSAGGEWQYVGQWDIIVSSGWLGQMCCNHYNRWIFNEVLLIIRVDKDSSLMRPYSTILGLISLFGTVHSHR